MQQQGNRHQAALGGPPTGTLQAPQMAPQTTQQQDPPLAQRGPTLGPLVDAQCKASAELFQSVANSIGKAHIENEFTTNQKPYTKVLQRPKT